jgi:hypothetical protein
MLYIHAKLTAECYSTVYTCSRRIMLSWARRKLLFSDGRSYPHVTGLSKHASNVYFFGSPVGVFRADKAPADLLFTRIIFWKRSLLKIEERLRSMSSHK